MMSLTSFQRSICLASLLVVGSSNPAWAQPEPAPLPPTSNPGDRAVQKGQLALGLYERGQWAEALSAFREADVLYHSPVLVLYQARSLLRLGRWLEAKEVFALLTREHLEEGAPTSWTQAQQEGIEEMAVLMREIPRLRIEVLGSTADTKIRVDGRAVRAGVAIELDPGEHTITVLDGAWNREEKRMLSRGAPLVALQFELPARPPPVVLANESDGPWQPMGVVLTSVGGSALIAAVVTGALALSKSNAAEAALPLSCTAERLCLPGEEKRIEESYAQAYTLGWATDGLLIAGGITAAGGIVMLLVAPKAEAKAPRVSGRALVVSF